MRVNVEVLEAILPAAVEAAGQLLRKPSSPGKNVPLLWRRADLAFVRALDFEATSKHKLEYFFVPCADELLPGKEVAVIGHAGGSAH